MGSIASAEKVVASKSAAMCGDVLLDLYSASVIVAVAAKLGHVNRAKLDAMPVEKAARICLKLVDAQKGA